MSFPEYIDPRLHGKNTKRPAWQRKLRDNALEEAALVCIADMLDNTNSLSRLALACAAASIRDLKDRK